MLPARPACKGRIGTVCSAARPHAVLRTTMALRDESCSSVLWVPLVEVASSGCTLPRVGRSFEDPQSDPVCRKPRTHRSPSSTVPAE